MQNLSNGSWKLRYARARVHNPHKQQHTVVLIAGWYLHYTVHFTLMPMSSAIFYFSHHTWLSTRCLRETLVLLQHPPPVPKLVVSVGLLLHRVSSVSIYRLGVAIATIHHHLCRFCQRSNFDFHCQHSAISLMFKRILERPAGTIRPNS